MSNIIFFIKYLSRLEYKQFASVCVIIVDNANFVTSYHMYTVYIGYVLVDSDCIGACTESGISLGTDRGWATGNGKHTKWAK